MNRSDSVVAQFHHGAIRVAYVQRSAITLRSESRTWSVDHLELARRGDRIEVGRFDHETEVVEAPVARLTGDEVDDRGITHTQRREEHFTAPPLVVTHRLEAEQIAVPPECRLDVGADKDDVIEPGDTKNCSHAAMLPHLPVDASPRSV